jgi:hypothetical protein
MRALILSLFLLVTGTVSAQRYSIGLATAYGNEVETFGYQLRAYYNVDHKTCFGPEFTYFPKTTELIGGQKVDVSLTEYNFNGHHHLYFGLEHLGIYPLGGFNYSIEKVGDEQETALGLNIGVGLHYSKKKWTFFTEVIHLTGDLSEETFVFGIFFTPRKSHKQHD